MENRVSRLELAILYGNSQVHFGNMNKTALNKNAKEASKIAQRIGTLQAAKIAAEIKSMEVTARKFKKKGRFYVSTN